MTSKGWKTFLLFLAWDKEWLNGEAGLRLDWTNLIQFLSLALVVAGHPQDHPPSLPRAEPRAEWACRKAAHWRQPLDHCKPFLWKESLCLNREHQANFLLSCTFHEAKSGWRWTPRKSMRPMKSDLEIPMIFICLICFPVDLDSCD